MSWDCCTPTGACQRGHGCPAGGCNQDCNQGRSCPARQLQHVQLDGPYAKKTIHGSLKLFSKRVAKLLAVILGVVVFTAATLAEPKANSQKNTSWMESA
jgi:hypothetical protein